MVGWASFGAFDFVFHRFSLPSYFFLHVSLHEVLKSKASIVWVENTYKQYIYISVFVCVEVRVAGWPLSHLELCMYCLPLLLCAPRRKVRLGISAPNLICSFSAA